MKVAQILNDKAHWIFETSETMEELQSRFATDIVFINVTNVTDIAEGYDYDSNTGSFSKHTLDVSALDTEYHPQFESIMQAYLTALTAGDTTTAAARQADYATLKAAYVAALEAIS